MKKTITYYLLSILFTLLIVLIYKATKVFVIGTFDSKFGALGTVTMAMFISGICASASSVSATVLFYAYNITKQIPLTFTEIIHRTFINGLFISLSYMPLIIHAPIINAFKDWPQYIIHFLLLGIIISFISNYICNKLKNLTRRSKRTDNP